MNVEPLYVTKDYVLDQRTISKGVFGILKNRRKVSPGTVKNIADQLQLGVHFDSPIVVNKVDGEYRIVDGNHRYEAIKKYLKSMPSSSVRVRLALYEDLTLDQEKEIYTRWNKGRKQSTNDVVKQYEEDIELFSHLRDTEPPIDVYGNNGYLSFFRVVGAYLAAHEPNFRGGYIGSAFEFVEDAMKLRKYDADIIRAFLIDFVAAFGPNGGGKNSWYKTTPFTAVFKIWFDNRHEVTPLKMQVILSKLAADGSARNWHNQGGSVVCVNARQAYLLTLNSGRRKNLFM